MKLRSLIFCLLLVPFTAMASDQKNCVDQAIIDFGIDINMYSDPSIVKDILDNDMKLASVSGVTHLLGAILTNPQPLKPIIMSMRNGIIEKHPGVVEVLCQAHQQKLLPKVDATRILNHIFIFDEIVMGMARDHHLMLAIHQAFLDKRSSFGIGEGKLETAMGIYETGGGLFGAAKAVTMDGVLKMYGDIRSRGYILEEEATARSNGLMLNIFEAYITDKVHLNWKNSKAGLALMTVRPAEVRVSGPHSGMQYVYSEQWTALYHLWNLIFILGNLDNLHLLLPKLIIPAVANAESNDYLFMRSLALWTSLNFSLFAKLEQKENVNFANVKEIAKIGGRISFNYAKAYLESVQENNHKAKALLLELNTVKRIEDRWRWFSSVIDGFSW